jgi:hypothetical protein
MTNNNLKDDHGLSAHIEVLEAMTSPSDTENQQLICLLLELKRRRANQTVIESELQQYRKAASEPKYWLSVHRFQSYLKFNKSDAERDVADNGGIFVVPLYTAPQLDYVLPSELLASVEDVIRISDRDHEAWDRVKAGISAYRTAMFNAGGVEWIGFDPAKDDTLATPDGWQLVPKEPTPEMREAFHTANEEAESGCHGVWSPDHQWQAMLAAIPKQEG